MRSQAAVFLKGRARPFNSTIQVVISSRLNPSIGATRRIMARREIISLVDFSATSRDMMENSLFPGCEYNCEPATGRRSEMKPVNENRNRLRFDGAALNRNSRMSFLIQAAVPGKAGAMSISVTTREEALKIAVC